VLVRLYRGPNRLHRKYLEIVGPNGRVRVQAVLASEVVGGA
jgi:hypothetical protein